MITCRQALDRAIAAAEQADRLAWPDARINVRDDLVVAYSSLARAWSSIADQLCLLEQYDDVHEHEGNGHA